MLKGALGLAAYFFVLGGWLQEAPRNSPSGPLGQGDAEQVAC